MSRQISFTPDGWDDYVYWQSQYKKILKKINQLVRDCQRSPFEGLGKPEPLREDLAGSWSRRITDEHRLVYTVINEEIRIFACRYHY
ncbi:Txe/YoeB family addiction module toxin [Candidatus Saccharibacteria bacterium]|nr:Txe/YoeB family addiction module toxin [Candidatus Saccharibacteria bacterium]